MGDPLFFETREVHGGAKLFHQQRRDMSWTAMIVLIRVGHMHDPVGREGTAHLLEHQVSNGRIGDLPLMTFEEMKSWLHRNRMWASLGTTALFWTRYGGTAENGNVRTLTRFLTDLVFRAGLDGDLDHEREIVRAERTHAARDRSDRIGEMIDRALFGDHRRTTATGLPVDAVLDAITREDVTTFRDRYYAPVNVRYVSIGGASTAKMHDLLQELTPSSGRPGAATVGPIPPLEIRRPEPRVIRQSREDGRAAETVSLKWKWCLPPTNEVVNVTAQVLRNLLHQRVREELRAVYAIQADAGHHYDHSSFTVATKVDAEKIEAVRQEVARILSDEDGIARVFRTRNHDPGLEEVFYDEPCGKVVERAANQVLANDRVRTLADSCAAVRRVTERQVLDFVRDRLAFEEALTVEVELQ